jgi:hypothetical protein
VVVSALMKLAGGSPSLAKELNVDAFLQQVPHSEHSTAQHLPFRTQHSAASADVCQDETPFQTVIVPSSPLCPI